MAVTRGAKILQSDLDALASTANAKAGLEGKPYLFLPRRWVILTPNARDFPPGWPNQGTSGVWDAASLSRLAGLQVGDVVINLKTGKFPFQCVSLPAVNQDGTWTGGSWRDLRNNPGFGKPSWYIVNTLAERDALGAVQDGSVCFIVNNQPTDLSVQGYFLEVRQGGQWKFYRGWSGELSRLRYAIGKALNIGTGQGLRLPYNALVSDRYQGQQFGSGAPAWWFDYPMPIGTPNPEVSTMQSLDVYWPEPAGINYTLTVVLPWIHAQVGGVWRTGFKADIPLGGTLSGYWSTSGFSVLQDDPTNPVPDPGFDYWKSQLSGPLAAYVTEVRNNSFNGGFLMHFGGNFSLSGECWLQWNFALPPGLHWGTQPDGKFYRSVIGSPTGEDGLKLTRTFSAVGQASVPHLHTHRSILKQDLRNDHIFAGALTGNNLPNGYYPFKPGGNFAALFYGPAIVGGDQYTRLLTTQQTVPIGVGNTAGDGTEMDAYRVLFALNQFDYVPTADKLVTRPAKGQFTRTVSTQSRGPNLFPNGPDLFPPQNHTPAQDNAPHACACKVYPVVYDPYDTASYTPFSTNDGKGQIIHIVAVRVPEEDDDGSAHLPEHPTGQIDVDVGCYRNGVFTALAHLSIADGSNYGIWDRPPNDPGIMVWEFYPLVCRCAASVQVYPLWFNAAYSGGLGTGDLLEIPGPNFIPASFTAVCPPMMPDHYNETTALLGLIS